MSDVLEAYAALRARPAWDEPSQGWHVPSGGDFHREIIAELKAGRDSGVIWVTAPSGAGLSSQLARLADLLRETGWQPIRVSLRGQAQPARTLGPVAALMLAVFWLLRALPQANPVLPAPEHRRIERLTQHLREILLIEQKSPASWVGALGQALFLAARRMRDPNFRAEIESDPKLAAGDWAEVVGALVGGLEGGGRVVLLVDDANELDQHQAADRLHTASASLWQGLPVHTVLSYPQRLDYCAEFAAATFGEPHITLRPLAGAERKSFFTELLRRKLPELKLEPEQLELVIESTHGNPKELLELLATALRLAATEGQGLQPQHLQRALAMRRDELRKLIGSSGALRRFARTGELPQDQAELARWLRLRAILEAGDGAGLQPHPVLNDLLHSKGEG